MSTRPNMPMLLMKLRAAPDLAVRVPLDDYIGKTEEDIAPQLICGVGFMETTIKHTSPDRQCLI